MAFSTEENAAYALCTVPSPTRVLLSRDMTYCTLIVHQSQKKHLSVFFSENDQFPQNNSLLENYALLLEPCYLLFFPVVIFFPRLISLDKVAGLKKSNLTIFINKQKTN